MKKFLLALIAVVMSASMVFADVDIWNIPDVITGGNSVKFQPTRVELIAGPEMVRIGVGVLNTGAIFNNAIAVAKDGTSAAKQGFVFIPQGFVTIAAKFAGVGIGLGYQYDLTRTNTGATTVLQEKIVASHGIGLGLAFLDNKLLINVPVFIGVADKKTYGINDKMPLVFGLKPWVKYVFGGKVMDYLKVTVDYGTIGKVDGVNNSKSASSFGAVVGLGMTFATDPVKIYSEPEIGFYTGLNSSKVVDVSVANTTRDWSSFYTADSKNNYMSVFVNFPVEFSGMIADSVKAYGKPNISIGYQANKVTVGTEKKAVFGIGYGIVVGITYMPVENLEVNLEGSGGTADKFDAAAGNKKFGGDLGGYVTYKF